MEAIATESRWSVLLVSAALLFAAAPAALGTTARAASDPTPGSPEYVQRDNQNMQDAYGRIPRASTHLEYTDIPYVLPASRYGQDFTSVYVQAWLDRYLKHKRNATKRLLSKRFTYLEPTGQGRWERVALRRGPQLSFYYCSAYGFHSPSGKLLADRDVGAVAGC